MSGRDFKNFLASHHSQIGQTDNRLATRFLSGQKPLYKSVDYEKLAALTKLKQSSGEQSMKRMEQLSRQKEAGKEKQMLSEHKRVWENEMRKLMREEMKLNHQLNLLKQLPPNASSTSSLLSSHRSSRRSSCSGSIISSTSATGSVFEDIVCFEDVLKEELTDFKEGTVEPLKLLCEDIAYYMNENRDQLLLGVHDNGHISNTIASVKEQQSGIMDQLDAEQWKLEDELAEFVSSFSSSFTQHLPEINVGLPGEIVLAECPDEALKDSCLSEFDTLDEKYVSKLEFLEEKYESELRKAPFGGWSEDEHLCFCHVINQYCDVTKNRRKLYLDCLQRVFSKRTRKSLTMHEEWWLSYKSFRRQVKDLMHAWKRDRDDLTLQVSTLFDEACVQYRKKQDEIVDHMKQKFVCNFLHKKLMQFQTERLELLKLEEMNRAVEEEELRRKRLKKESAEESRRRRDKEKITARKEQRMQEEAVLTEQQHARMLELQEKRALQRVHDEERIKYRQEKFEEKKSAELLKKQRAEEEASERERRLQLLCDQVAVNVEDNPLRVYEPTAAFKAHVAVPEHEELEAQEPLFKTYTYSVEQIAADKRVKIENALRRANVHMTEYGRHVLSTIQPPTKPRKDQQSTLFKSE